MTSAHTLGLATSNFAANINDVANVSAEKGSDNVR